MDEATRYRNVKIEIQDRKQKECESHMCYKCKWLSHFYYKNNYDAVFVCMLPRCQK